jgi:hypothetical protein
MPDFQPGANPTIASYNVSVVKIYSATNSMVRFRIKIILPLYKNALAYFDAGVVSVCRFKSRRNGSWDRCYDFLNIFAEKVCKKNGVFDSKQSYIFKKLIITLVFKKTPIVSENWEKSQKIMIITSTPGLFGIEYFYSVFLILLS